MSIFIPELTTNKQFFTQNDGSVIQLVVHDNNLYITKIHNGVSEGGSICLDPLPPTAILGEFGDVTESTAVEGEYNLAVDSEDYTEEEMVDLGIALQAELEAQFPGTTISVNVVSGSLVFKYTIVPDDIDSWNMTDATGLLDSEAKNMLKAAATTAGKTALASDIESDTVTLSKVVPQIKSKVLPGMVKSISYDEGTLTVVTIGGFKELKYSSDGSAWTNMVLVSGNTQTLAISRPENIKVRLYNVANAVVSQIMAAIPSGLISILSKSGLTMTNFRHHGNSVWLTEGNAEYHMTDARQQDILNLHHDLPDLANNYKRLRIEMSVDAYWGRAEWTNRVGAVKNHPIVGQELLLFHAGNVAVNQAHGSYSSGDPGRHFVDYNSNQEGYRSIYSPSKLGGYGIIPGQKVWGSISIKMNDALTYNNDRRDYGAGTWTRSSSHAPVNSNGWSRAYNEDYNIIVDDSGPFGSNWTWMVRQDWTVFKFQDNYGRSTWKSQWNGNYAIASPEGPAYGLFKFQISGKDGNQTYKSFGMLPKDHFGQMIGWAYILADFRSGGGYTSSGCEDIFTNPAKSPNGFPERRVKFTFDITNDADGVYDHLHGTAHTPTSVVYYVKVEYLGADRTFNAGSADEYTIATGDFLEFAYRDLDFDVNNLPELSPQPENNFLYDYYDSAFYAAERDKIRHVLPTSDWNNVSGRDHITHNESPVTDGNWRVNGGCWLCSGGWEFSDNGVRGIRTGIESGQVPYGNNGTKIWTQFKGIPGRVYINQVDIFIEK